MDDLTEDKLRAEAEDEREHPVDDDDCYCEECGTLLESEYEDVGLPNKQLIIYCPKCEGREVLNHITK